MTEQIITKEGIRSRVLEITSRLKHILQLPTITQNYSYEMFIIYQELLELYILQIDLGWLDQAKKSAFREFCDTMQNLQELEGYYFSDLSTHPLIHVIALLSAESELINN